MSRLTNNQFLESPVFPFFMQIYKITSAIDPHSHEFVELVFVRKGRGHHSYRGENFAISEGDVFVIEPEVEHAYDIEPNHTLEVYNVLFHPSFLTNEMRALAEVESFVDFYYMEPFIRNAVMFRTRLSLPPAQRTEADFLLQNMLAEFTGKNSGYRILLRTKLIELLVFLSRGYTIRKADEFVEQGDDAALMKRTCEFIAAHCDKPLTLDQVCRMCGLGSTAFTLKFKHYTGRTFLEYRNEMRIRLSEMLLAETNRKIISIALETGFEDISHFNRTFKQFTGFTPKAYRLRKNQIM